MPRQCTKKNGKIKISLMGLHVKEKIKGSKRRE